MEALIIIYAECAEYFDCNDNNKRKLREVQINLWLGVVPKRAS